MEKSNSQKDLQEMLFILFCHLCLLGNTPGCLSRSLGRLTAKMAAILSPLQMPPHVLPAGPELELGLALTDEGQ